MVLSFLHPDSAKCTVLVPFSLSFFPFRHFLLRCPQHLFAFVPQRNTPEKMPDRQCFEVDVAILDGVVELKIRRLVVIPLPQKVSKRSYFRVGEVYRIVHQAERIS